MGVGIGVLLLIAGALLRFALQVDIPGVDDSSLGVILMIAGALAIVLAVVTARQRNRTRHVEERHEL